MAYFFSPFSSFFSSPFLLLSSRCSPRGKKKEGTKQAAGPSLEETGEKAWISPPFLVLEPRSLPPLLEKPDLPCSASSPPAALALWGRIGLFFLIREFLPCTTAGLFSPCSSGFSWRIMVSDRSVS
ncbi:hypothetical protein SLEP1_g55570 [Rubroshorea leprosula]|uniref:Secreted protein n=1 Tax=Rubroshorea leprosula TaxID=152421 RepID=A0AAV5MK02_9ROSI|nr:hypothetical protein SLEP1_g55570 [Rubroshorea leprosula]